MVMSIASHTTPAMISLLVTDSQDKEVMQNMCYEETLEFLPELLGKLYLDIFAKLSPIWRKEMDNMVNLLRQSFQELLTASAWMDQETIGMAIKKLNYMKMHIGFPDWYGNKTIFEKYCTVVVSQSFAQSSSSWQGHFQFDKIDGSNYFSSVVDVIKAGQMLEMADLSERLNTGASSSTLSK